MILTEAERWMKINDNERKKWSLSKMDFQLRMVENYN